MEEFPYNNLLHLRVDSIIMASLDAKNHSLTVVENITDSAGLATLIMKAQNKEDQTI